MKHFETNLIDLIAAVTPWLAPLIPAYLVYFNMTTRLEYPWPIALVGAAAVEFLGLSAVHTAVTFWQWNDNHKVERAPFWIALGAGMFYVVIVLTVNAALDLADGSKEVRIFSHALLSLLSVDAAIIIAIRASHARVLKERDDDKKARQVARQAAKSGVSDAPPDATPPPVTRQPATREEFVTAWSANGHESIAALAASMGVNVRTAQRWIAKDNDHA